MHVDGGDDGGNDGVVVMVMEIFAAVKRSSQQEGCEARLRRSLRGPHSLHRTLCVPAFPVLLPHLSTLFLTHLCVQTLSESSRSLV